MSDLLSAAKCARHRPSSSGAPQVNPRHNLRQIRESNFLGRATGDKGCRDCTSEIVDGAGARVHNHPRLQQVNSWPTILPNPTPKGLDRNRSIFPQAEALFCRA